MSKQRVAVALLALSAAGFTQILWEEGWADKASAPLPGDKATYGFGTTEGVKIGDTITPPQAVVRALSDVNKFEGALKKCVKVPLHQHEYDSLIDFSYNVGSANFCGSTLVEKLNKGDYAGACAEITRWVYFRKMDCRLPENKCGGLPARRERTRAMCEGWKLKEAA